MNDKTLFKIKLMEGLNNLELIEGLTNLEIKYNWHELKQFIKYMSQYKWHNNCGPLWLYSYNQGFFNVAIEDIKDKKE